MRVKRDDLPTRQELIRQGCALYLKHGFYETSNKTVAQAAGVQVGSLNNCFPTKEDLLVVVLERVAKVRDEFFRQTAAVSSPQTAAVSSPLSEFGLEIAVLLELCERYEKLRELYTAGYSMPKTLESIRRNSCRKTQSLLGGRLTDWTGQDFYEVEIMASGILFGCLMERCDVRFTIRQKTERCLDNLLKIYDVEKEERIAVMRQVTACDPGEMADLLFCEIMKMEAVKSS